MAFSQIAKQSIDGHTITVRHAKEKDQDDLTMLPNLFEPDFTLAAATGYIKVWDGSRVLLRWIREVQTKYAFSAAQLAAASSTTAPVAVRRLNVVELGSGTGFLGLCIAAMGANILLTDIQSTLRFLTNHNIALNEASAVEKRKKEKAEAKRKAREEALAAATAAAAAAAAAADGTGAAAEEKKALDESRRADSETSSGSSTPTCEPSFSYPALAPDETPFFVEGVTPYRVGNGRVASLTIDWSNETISPTVIDALQKTDVIIASDCMFTEELSFMFAETCARLLKHCPAEKDMKVLLAFPNRGYAYYRNAFISAGLDVEFVYKEQGKPPHELKMGDPFDISVVEISLAKGASK